MKTGKKYCTTCNMPIPANARKCPYCLSDPNEGFEWWYDFWDGPIGRIVTFLILTAFIALCGYILYTTYTYEPPAIEIPTIENAWF